MQVFFTQPNLKTHELVTNRKNRKSSRAYPGSEFVVAITLAKWKKLEPNEINFSQKVVS